MFGFGRKADAAKVENALAGVVDALVLIAELSGNAEAISDALVEKGGIARAERRAVLMEIARRLKAASPAVDGSSGERLDSLMARFDN